MPLSQIHEIHVGKYCHDNQADNRTYHATHHLLDDEYADDDDDKARYVISEVCHIFLFKQRSKLCRDRSLKLHRLARNRMVETEHVGVKTKSVKRIITIAVFYIATHRMPHIRSMNTYLVLTTCFKTELDE